MVFANYADGSAGRTKRRKGSSRVGSHRGTRYTTIDIFTDRLKLTTTGERRPIPTGDSHVDSVTWLLVSNISGGFTRVSTTLASPRRTFTTSSALGQPCLPTAKSIHVSSPLDIRELLIYGERRVEF